MVQEWNIVSKGRHKLLSIFRDLKFDGYVDDISFYGYRLDGLSGIANFGVKLRGLTGGQCLLEFPLAFDAERDLVSDPVVVFIDGRSYIFSQELLDDLFNSLNLKKKFIPKGGWINNFLVKDFYSFSFNPVNKYDIRLGSISDNELKKAFGNFLICLGATKATVLEAVRVNAEELKNLGYKVGDALFQLLVHFLGSASLDDICEIVKEVWSFNDEEIDKNRLLKASGGGFKPFLVLGQDEPLPEGEKSPIIEPIKSEPSEREVDLIIPEHFERIEFPTPYQLQQLIKLYRVIRFSYRKLNGEYTMREVEPHYLWITKKGNIIMICWDYQRGNWRAFDIARIRDVDVSYFGEWKELGEFMAMLEKAKEKGIELPINYRDIFRPRGPYSDRIVTKRLHHLIASSGIDKSKLGLVLRNKVLLIEDILRNCFTGNI